MYFYVYMIQGKFDDHIAGISRGNIKFRNPS
jgi:hypothetical protein